MASSDPATLIKKLVTSRSIPIDDEDDKQIVYSVWAFILSFYSNLDPPVTVSDFGLDCKSERYYVAYVKFSKNTIIHLRDLESIRNVALTKIEDIYVILNTEKEEKLVIGVKIRKKGVSSTSSFIPQIIGSLSQQQQKIFEDLNTSNKKRKIEEKNTKE